MGAGALLMQTRSVRARTRSLNRQSAVAQRTKGASVMTTHPLRSRVGSAGRASGVTVVRRQHQDASGVQIPANAVEAVLRSSAGSLPTSSSPAKARSRFFVQMNVNMLGLLHVQQLRSNTQDELERKGGLSELLLFTTPTT